MPFRDPRLDDDRLRWLVWVSLVVIALACLFSASRSEGAEVDRHDRALWKTGAIVVASSLDAWTTEEAIYRNPQAAEGNAWGPTVGHRLALKAGTAISLAMIVNGLERRSHSRAATWVSVLGTMAYLAMAVNNWSIAREGDRLAVGAGAPGVGFQLTLRF
jgi:hypothetical protein